MSLKISLQGIILCTVSLLTAKEPHDLKLKMLYDSIPPSSISQHIAFYELYPHHPLGQQSLNQTSKLLLRMESAPPLKNSMIELINKTPNQPIPICDEDSLILLQALSQNLPHYPLKGHSVWSEKEVLDLPVEEIDLARAVLISQLEGNRSKILSYEGMLDLMALQILARLSKNATPDEKIKAMNYFVFEEMEFRFPPHSIYIKDIDQYTFLSSVLDSHRGVCLGVSILYLCLAQRLDLQLEMITPPGHIYVRYRDKDHLINIETTARGIHIDCEHYLNIDNRSLQTRTIREVIGLSHVNHSSLYFREGQYEKALSTYQKAFLYLPEDLLVKELMGYAYLFVGEEKKGTELLKAIAGETPPHTIYRDCMAEDYLNGDVDIEGLKVIFQTSEETRASKVEKKDILEKVIESHPKFRAGLLNLAMIWMELHRAKEALKCLKNYHDLNPNDPSVEYYLAILYQERLDYPKAWRHLHRAEEIVRTKNHSPKELKELRQNLNQQYPEQKNYKE
jgi:regulator of sirC expression with transglutaminase-like and TPR domain